MQDHYLELVEQSSQAQEGFSEPPIIDKMTFYY